MRITIIDGFRGFFLLFMMIVHANMPLRVLSGKLNHHYFGWVEDAQGFVFISGLVVALVYGRIGMRKGEAAMSLGIRKRVRTIYSHQVGLVLILFATALTTQYFLGQTSPFLRPYVESPLTFLAGSLLLVTGSANMGILPMYILFMLATPMVLRLFHRGYLLTPIAFSLILWLAAQSGIGEHMVNRAEEMLAAHGMGIRLGLFFNPLGWQLLFFSGALFGYLLSVDKLDLSILDGRDALGAFLICLLAFVGLGIYDRLAFGSWLPPETLSAIMGPIDRGNLSILYVLAFAVDLFLFVWLIRAAPTCGIPLFEAAGRFVTWIFTRPALVFLGQHSLHVFSAHILIFYALDLLLVFYRPGVVMANLIVLLSPLPLYAVAWAHKRQVLSDKRAKEATGASPA
ncbi:OpgC family protein [Haematobacter massiliensis]|uniref:OpgC family protein n=1 Tax=Haematobacter massiliensis TaxID=195105 RepID=UPI0023F58005|nr:OpgC domain-containing protein [Haematobacter massiliensis]